MFAERKPGPTATAGPEVLDQDAPDRPMIQCVKLTKTFPSPDNSRETFTAIDSIDIDIDRDAFVTVLGPSGCGKSTLLGMIAGFEPPSGGELLVDGEPVAGPSPDKGVVFQEYALFPWLTVRHNVGYGLKERRVPQAERTEIVDRMLEMVGLEHVGDHYPRQLSGGLKQRVALARVLANDPKILLLDEPFGALDEQRRMFLQDELLRIWERDRKTALFVTHSIEEAVVLGDKVVVMSAHPGRIRSVIDVDLPRPRDRTSDEFNALRRQVSSELWT